MKKGNSTIGILNLLLIAFSFCISFFYPISTFILAYSILGPLHYLTQLNWINHIKVFSKSKTLKNTVLILSVIATIFYLIEYKTELNINWYWGRIIMAGVVLLAIMSTILSLSKFSVKKKVTILIPIVILSTALSANTSYLIIVGVLFVSVIHVYLFTLLHMISGTIKNKSKIDLINAMVMIIAPALIYYYPLAQYTLGNEYFSNNQFISGLTSNLSYLLGYRDDAVNSVVFFKLAWFIAFAYLYHYLNWFSKTKIIHWNDGLTKKKTIMISSLSLIFSSFYLLGFEIGLIATLFLSYLHVFAELPLNYLSIKHIIKGLSNK